MHPSRVLVIGNGESRKPILLQQYINKIITVGCNAIHRDTIVDHLVCVDARMVVEACGNVNTSNTKIYSNNASCANVNKLPKLPFLENNRAMYHKNWSSGTYALLIASQLMHSTIYIVGFDLHNTTGYVNNMYKDTSNYAPASSHAVDPVYWIYQTACILRHFSQHQFVFVNTPTWSMPVSWQLPNVSHISVDTFITYNF